MGLNVQKGNMYGFISHTWNTVKGRCIHDCSYCYMRRFGKQNDMRFDEKELSTDLGTGNNIFVGSSCDMWAIDVPLEWKLRTLAKCKEHDNRYLFQTKDPEGFFLGHNQEYSEYHEVLRDYPGKSVFCITMESNRFYKEHMGTAPSPKERAWTFSRLDGHRDQRMITIEPVMDFDVVEFFDVISDVGPSQVNIGANTSRVKLPEPTGDKINELVAMLEAYGIMVHLKDNLKRIYDGRSGQV